MQVWRPLGGDFGPRVSTGILGQKPAYATARHSVALGASQHHAKACGPARQNQAGRGRPSGGTPAAIAGSSGASARSMIPTSVWNVCSAWSNAGPAGWLSRRLRSHSARCTHLAACFRSSGCTARRQASLAPALVAGGRRGGAGWARPGQPSDWCCTLAQEALAGRRAAGGAASKAGKGRVARIVGRHAKHQNRLSAAPGMRTQRARQAAGLASTGAHPEAQRCSARDAALSALALGWRRRPWRRSAGAGARPLTTRW